MGLTLAKFAGALGTSALILDVVYIQMEMHSAESTNATACDQSIDFFDKYITQSPYDVVVRVAALSLAALGVTVMLLDMIRIFRCSRRTSVSSSAGMLVASTTSSI